MYTDNQPGLPGRDAECGYGCYSFVARISLAEHTKYLVRHEEYIQDSLRAQILIKWLIATASGRTLRRSRVPKR